MRLMIPIANRLLALAAVGLCISQPAWAETGPLFHFIERAGPHAVGVRVVEQFDYSRSFGYTTDDLGRPAKGERARPLQTLIWFPAQKSHAKPMTVLDYANLLGTETRFGQSWMPESAKQWLSATSPALATALWAVRDAPPASGRFPVVIYAPSFSAKSWENADLCEYLASYGYVVVASPDMGATTRNMTLDLVGINAQARDISFLIGYAQSLPNTDVSAVAVAGFSWGGISNLFAAARDNRIDALIALDGSMRYWPGFVQQAGDVHPEQMTIPLLYLAQGEFTFEDQARYLSQSQLKSPNVLNAWTHGDLVIVHMLGLTHQEFSSMFQRNEEVWKDFYDSNFSDREKADYGREDGITGYGWVARYTLHFLDAYLKHDVAAMAYLKKTSAENGAPRHFLSVAYRAASGVAPSFNAFRAEIGRQGFDHAGDILGAMQKGRSDFKLEEDAVNSWSEALQDANHLPEALILLKLNVQMHSDSSGVYANLGEAYQKSGQTQLAIDNYKTSLEKDPDNEGAKRKLAELQGRASAAH